MLARALSWLIFVVLMTCNIAASTVVVIFLYLPFVALKAVVQAVRGKAKIKPGSAEGEQPTFHIG